MGILSGLRGGGWEGWWRGAREGLEALGSVLMAGRGKVRFRVLAGWFTHACLDIQIP